MPIESTGTSQNRENSKAWNRRVAEWLGTPTGIRLARHLQLRSQSDAASQGSPPRPDGTERPEAISIWKRIEIDGQTVFQRPEPTLWGDHYASTRTIEATKAAAKKRICLFGESVAAGYLYAPHLTPASVLSHQLRLADTEQAYEVIDLARTNETIDGLTSTVGRALQLNPDLIVVFAGNNWTLLETPEVSPYIPALLSRVGYGKALQRNGLLGPIEQASRQLLHKSSTFLGELAAIASGRNIPVVLVLPEVNLADWENRQPVAWLPGFGARDWYRHYHRALDHLARERWDEATQAAGRMIDLDGYTCPSSQRVLAKARMGAGDREGARQASRAEIDANQYPTLCFLGTPQATPLIQGILERSALHYGFSLVDLRRRFQDWMPRQLPGRRLFLDYCHLTAEGMHVAMAGVASEVVRLLSQTPRRPDWMQLAQTIPRQEISAAAESTTFLGAAIHNAHRLLTVGAKAPILEYWCRQALQLSPGVQDAMLNLIALRLGPGQELHRGHLRNLESEFTLGFQHGLRYPHLDAELIRTILSLLSQGDDRPDLDEVLDRRARDGVAVDLASPRNLWEPVERFYPEVIASQDPPPAAFYRSAWPTSSFALLSRQGRDLKLEITARLPTIDPDNPPSGLPVRVLVNGAPAAGFSSCGQWQKTNLNLPAKLLAPGLNQLTLLWPFPQSTGEAALTNAAHRLQRGLPADIHPVFGEVAELLASWC